MLGQAIRGQAETFLFIVFNYGWFDRLTTLSIVEVLNLSKGY